MTIFIIIIYTNKHLHFNHHGPYSSDRVCVPPRPACGISLHEFSPWDVNVFLHERWPVSNTWSGPGLSSNNKTPTNFRDEETERSNKQRNCRFWLHLCCPWLSKNTEKWIFQRISNVFPVSKNVWIFHPVKVLFLDELIPKRLFRIHQIPDHGCYHSHQTVTLPNFPFPKPIIGGSNTRMTSSLQCWPSPWLVFCWMKSSPCSIL